MKNNNEILYIKNYLKDLAEYGLTPSELENAALDRCRKYKISLSIEKIEEAVFSALQQNQH